MQESLFGVRRQTISLPLHRMGTRQALSSHRGSTNIVECRTPLIIRTTIITIATNMKIFITTIVL